MKCPYCLDEGTKVVDKRDSPEECSTRRRRECLKCGKRFTTYERIERSLVTVIKKDERRETFDRGKLMAGILKACEKRPVERESIENLVDEVEAELMTLGNEVASKVIGRMVMQKLKKLDQVAYIRFASVYREFTDLESFEKELQKLLRRPVAAENRKGMA